MQDFNDKIYHIIDDINKEIKIKSSLIRDLPSFRKRILGLKKIYSSDVFCPPKDDSYSYNYGGRKELQFNIAIEKDPNLSKCFLRYGIAFSFQPSRTLTDPIKQLSNQVKRLNYIIRNNSEYFSDYKMWFWLENGKRTEDFEIMEISEQYFKCGNFVFIGKKQYKYCSDEIIDTFDNLYPIYQEILDENNTIISSNNPPNMFVFSKIQRRLPLERKYTTIEKEINSTIRHTLLQEKLVYNLSLKYGDENVCAEHEHGGNRIDIVVHSDDGNIFYEIKTANTARQCIREALGQLFDYSYYPDQNNAKQLIVVGEPCFDTEAKKYVKKLNQEFNIPIQYKCIAL